MPVPNSIDDLNTVASENYPAGSEQVFPNLDNYLRAHAACIAQLRDEVRASGLPIGGSMWWGGLRAALPANLMPEDGDLANRVDYPELWAFVSNGGYPAVPESDWQADNKKRASFSLGNGSTTFRFPDNNGKQPGSLGAVVKRGDGANAAAAPGLIQDSQNKEHGHAASTNQTGAHTHTLSGTTSSAGLHSHTLIFNHNQYDHGITGNVGDNGGLNPTRTQGSMSADGAHTHQLSGSATSAGSHTHVVTIENSGGSEARGISTTGCHVMRVR